MWELIKNMFYAQYFYQALTVSDVRMSLKMNAKT